jgi:hypothetical protein
MTQVSLDDWDKARTVFYNVLNAWDDQTSHVQAQMAEMHVVIESNINMLAQKAQADKRTKNADRNITTKQRKAVRDQLIPDWCIENLKPGMIVKVKAANSRLRQIVSIQGSMLLGHHCHYVRLRDRDTQEFTISLRLDGYITDHMFKNVQGVVRGVDHMGRAIVSPIMDLVEGRDHL